MTQLDAMAAATLGFKFCESIQHIPEGESGLYQVKNDVNIDQGYIFQTLCYQGKPISNNDPVTLPAHKHIIKKARGRVLVSGLGLGNSLHELLKKDNVSEVVIIEKEQDIIDLVSPSFSDPRVKIEQGDIFQFEPSKHFDCIYHAIWNTEKETRAAVQVRKELKAKFASFCDAWQGFIYISPRGGNRGGGRPAGSTGAYKSTTRKIQKGVRYLPKEFEIIEKAAKKAGKTPAEIAQDGAVNEAVRILLGIEENKRLEEFIKQTIR